MNHRELFYLGGKYLKDGNLKKGLELYHHRIFFHPDFVDITKLFDYKKHIIHEYKNFEHKIIQYKKVSIILEQGYGDIFMWIRYILFFSNCTLYIMVANNFHKNIIRSLDYTLRLSSTNRKTNGMNYNGNNIILVDHVDFDYDYWTNICDLTLCFGLQNIGYYIRSDDYYSKKWFLCSIIRTMDRRLSGTQ